MIPERRIKLGVITLFFGPLHQSNLTVTLTCQVVEQFVRNPKGWIDIPLSPNSDDAHHETVYSAHFPIAADPTAAYTRNGHRHPSSRIWC